MKMKELGMSSSPRNKLKTNSILKHMSPKLGLKLKPKFPGIRPKNLSLQKNINVQEMIKKFETKKPTSDGKIKNGILFGCPNLNVTNPSVAANRLSQSRSRTEPLLDERESGDRNGANEKLAA